MEISKLVSLDYDIDVLGFDGDELAELLAQPTVGLVDPDEVPEAPAEPLTRLGDKWRLGNHVLLCGDATKPTDVARLMDGARATLMATDPPYLVDYDGGNHPPTWANGGKQPGAAPDSRHEALGRLRRPRYGRQVLPGLPHRRSATAPWLRHRPSTCSSA